MGQTARWQRFCADMLYAIAAGRHIDTDRTPKFWPQVDEVYRNPFRKEKQQPKTAEEIKEHMLQLIRANRERLAREAQEEKTG